MRPGPLRGEVVTVFGGTGFVGRYVVKRLAETSATVCVPTRRPSAALFLKPLGAPGQIVLKPWHGRGTAAGLAHLVAGSTHVVNLIGILAERRKGEFEEVQGRLPGAIGAAATECGTSRMVQVSAIGADPSSASAYARTKAQGEAAARAAFPGATVLRPSIVFGREDGFFNRFARMAQLSPILPLIGGGRTRFQPVYVGDVASAVVAALGEAGHAGKTFELGGPSVYTFRELMEFMLRTVGRRRALVNVPFRLAALQARALQLLPDPPLTVDQVELLKRDNVVAPAR